MPAEKARWLCVSGNMCLFRVLRAALHTQSAHSGSDFMRNIFFSAEKVQKYTKRV
jgi:hypothetical protein